jgi:hypothetical protein
MSEQIDSYVKSSSEAEEQMIQKARNTEIAPNYDALEDWVFDQEFLGPETDQARLYGG